MILRRGMAGVESDADYLSAAAHPTAFDGAGIELERMIRRAAALRPEAVPPAPELAVLDDPSDPGEMFGDGLSERLFDTPDAVARIARGALGERRYRLGATAAPVAGGAAPRFVWRVLRGPGATVAPLDPQGREAVATIPWTAPYAVPGRPEMETFRVDVAVFAEAGGELSAPAFFSVAFPPTELRDHDAEGRVRTIRYDPPELAERYADPLLFPWRGWRDDYIRDAEGRSLGWTRTHPDGTVERFSAHGMRALERDAQGRIATAEAVDYPIRPALRRERDGRPRVTPQGAGVTYRYRYDGPEDTIGRPFRVEDDAKP